MLDIVKTSQNHNGNGSDAIGGRGIRRRKLTLRQRVALGADIALGVTSLAPSLKQSAAAVGISVLELRQELKAREWRRAVERRLQVQTEAEMVNAQADAIVAAWQAASPMVREAAVRTSA
jgi:hypothetical protein